MKTIRILCLIFAINCGILCPAQSKIGQSKSDLSKDNPLNNTSDNNRSYRSNSSIDETDIFFLWYIGKAFKYILVGNYENENHLKNDITPYPYYNRKYGNYDDSVSLKRTRLDISDKFLLGSNHVSGNDLQLDFHPCKYLYLKAGYTQLMDYESLALMNLDFCYDRIKNPYFDLGWTVGLRYAGSGINKFGPSFGFQTNLFLIKSLSIYANTKWSSINNAPVNQSEAGIKFYKRNFAISAGYLHYKIGGPDYHFVSMGLGIYL
jgi:hypothetical protein